MGVAVRLRAKEFAVLLGEARRGSSEAAGELFDAFYPMLVEYAHSWLCRELRRRFDPCDLAQHTLTQAIQGLGETRAATPREFAGWLRAILRNRAARLALRYIRRRDGRARPRSISLGRLSAPSEDEAPRDGSGGTARVLISAIPSPEDAAIAREESRAIRQAVAALAVTAAKIVILRVRQGRSFETIGARLGITREAARSRFRRAMKELKRNLDAERPDVSGRRPGLGKVVTD